MNLYFIIAAREKYGYNATVRGNGPYALVSLCYKRRLVLLYSTAQTRDQAYATWQNCGCGAGAECFGDTSHQRAELKEVPPVATPLVGCFDHRK